MESQQSPKLIEASVPEPTLEQEAQVELDANKELYQEWANQLKMIGAEPLGLAKYYIAEKGDFTTKYPTADFGNAHSAFMIEEQGDPNQPVCDVADPNHVYPNPKAGPEGYKKWRGQSNETEGQDFFFVKAHNASGEPIDKTLRVYRTGSPKPGINIRSLIEAKIASKS